jgi:hypothetical protein
MTVMTREEAKKAVADGQKITHKYFLSDEYITSTDGGKTYQDEVGNKVSAEEFWKWRLSYIFDTEWSIYQ